MDKQIYAMIGVDMETDVGSFTPFYEGTKHGTPKLIQLFQQKGIKGTFYFTGDCAKKNPKVAEMVLNSGNEIGCHSLYHETVGDELFPIPNEHPLLPHEVMPRIRLATQWIEDIAGVRPVSFRSPRLFGSTAVVNALEELGYVTDASYPMYFYRQRFFPYHPSRDDWTKEGNLRILELPNFADMTMKSQDPGIERDRDQWPLFRTKGSEYILQRIKSFIEFCNANSVPRFLCFYIHPWEFHPMKEQYNFGEAQVIPEGFITQGCGDRALEELSKMIDGLLEMGAVFKKAVEYTQIFG